MATKTENFTIGDLIVFETHPAVNYVNAKLAFTAGVLAGARTLGYPVIESAGVATIQTAAQVAAFTDGTSLAGVVADSKYLAAEGFTATPSASRYRIVKRGPYVVKRDGLPLTDPAGAAYNMTKLIIALQTAGIQVVDSTGLAVVIAA